MRSGFSSDLDHWRALRNNGETILEEYRLEEQGLSGLSHLKLKYNKIIGYYFELSKTQLAQLPAHFVRKQSLMGSERFTTPRLEALEKDILDSEAKILGWERDLFLEVRRKTREKLPLILEAAAWLAATDGFQGLAHTALTKGYVEPELKETGELVVVHGRHPVVEAFQPPGTFVPNSLAIGGDFHFALITGPNMAGKSTFLRQTALIVLLAQIGSFVPAESASIPLADRIFCRVGASDNLARGESTFLVEMNETAFILRNAGPRSLVIMDEVGRGTSTTDGLAIAWAVSEYLLNNLACKTLFATHFHELTLLEHPALKNFSMAVEERGAEVTFLRKVLAQPSDNSYGLYVAALAGIPGVVVDRARQIQEELEVKEEREVRTLSEPLAPPSAPQLVLFPEEELVIQALKSLSLDQLTPLSALQLLYQWKEKLAGLKR